MDILKSANITKLFILAILIRLLLMPFYFHPDIKTYNFQVSFLQKGTWNIYDYLSANKENLPLKEEFVYFPLTYFFLGGYQYLAQPLLGSNFSTWLSNSAESSFSDIGTFRYIFILKLPYLLFDLAIAFILIKFFQDRGKQKQIFLIWLFNPFSIALIYFFSNIDVIVVFLTLLSLLLFQKNKFFLSALLIGIGAGFKVYPLLFLPFLLLAVQNTKTKLTIFITAALSFLVIIAPFITSSGFRQSTLVSGLTTRLFQSAINIGFGETMILPVVIISAMFFWALLKGGIKKEELAVYITCLLLILFASIHYHIQWILWVMPFMVLLMVKDNTLIKIIIPIMIIFITIPLLYQDRFMSVDLLLANHQAFKLLPSPFIVVQKIFDPFAMQSILHSILAGMVATLIWYLFKNIRKYE